MTTERSNRCFTKNLGKITERKLGEEQVLIPICSDIGNMSSLFQLNPSAALIWELARDGVGEVEIVRQITQRFEVDEAEARRDVAEVLDQLLGLGALLEQTGTPG